MGKKTDLDIRVILGRTNLPFPSTRSNSRSHLLRTPSYLLSGAARIKQFVLKLWFTTEKNPS